MKSLIGYWRTTNYHNVSHAIPLSFLRIQQLVRDDVCITPTCSSCKVEFSLEHPARQLNCGHVFCGPCIVSKCLRENGGGCLNCGMRAVPSSFDYSLDWEGEPLQKMKPTLFREAVSKALYGYGHCLASQEYQPIDPAMSHSNGGLGRSDRTKGLCHVQQKERHKLTVAAMVIMAPELPPVVVEGEVVSSKSPFSQSDAEFFLNAIWESIDHLDSLVYHDTHAELVEAIVIGAGRAVNKIRTIDFESKEIAALREQVGMAVAFAGEFHDYISYLCDEMGKLNMSEDPEGYLRANKWETGIASQRRK